MTSAECQKHSEETLERQLGFAYGLSPLLWACSWEAEFTATLQREQ